MGEKISDRLWKNAADMRIPLIAAIELLPMCNLRCKMCYVRKSASEAAEAGGLMSADQILDILAQAQKLGLLFPLFTGGEPFLRDDFQQIYIGAEHLGMKPSINTNGTLIDEDTAQWLSKHPPIRVNMTLYGASEESYENLCGDGSAYERVRNAITCLKRHNIRLKFNASITKENINELPQIIDIAKSVGSPIQVATYMFPPIRRDSSMVGQNDRLSPEDAAYAKVLSDWLQSEPEWFLKQSIRYSHFIPLDDDRVKHPNQPVSMEMKCRAGRCSMWVDWQGMIGGCGMYSPYKISVKDHTVEEAWNMLVNETNQFRYMPVCSSCPNLWLCHSCVAMVHNECGEDTGRPEYLCKMHAKTAELYQEFSKQLPNTPLSLPEHDDQSYCSVDEI